MESPDQGDERIVRVREALMCPDGEKFEGLRTARFLNHTTTSIDDDVFELPLNAFAPVRSTVKVSFSGWGSPSMNWVEWVNSMGELHATVWKKAGVFNAIMASRYQIKKEEDLMMGLVENWCVETNTFVFPWGEGTVTLEDMIVLGGFSVIGNNALGPIKREGMKEVEEKMKEKKREIEVDLGKKCCAGFWMKEMMNSGNEIEHEAFMVSWLSRFVFPNPADLVREKLFPAAIQLANGVRLALAPAVLAGIYRDLGVLKECLSGHSEKETVVVKAPFQLVQVWAWERFMELQPPGLPSQLKHGDPRIARWHHHGGSQDVYRYPDNVRAVLDSAKESFDYRPYTKPLTNFKFPKFYLEDDSWVGVATDENIVALGRCLRFSKLVGLDCIEPYYPHRVALQFGYDQDVPGVVISTIESPELAWKHYIRPISDEMLYIPARLHEADVTVGYLRWWKVSAAHLQAEAKKISQKLLASPPIPKPVTTPAAATTTTTTTTTKESSFSQGKWKTSGAKPEGKDQELVKKMEIETKTGSKIEVNRESGSEQTTKKPIKMPEWVQRSPRTLTKSLSTSSERAGENVKDLKGALKESGVTKNQGHVTFQLPGSSPGRSPSKAPTLSPKQSDSPVKKAKWVPRVATLSKQSSSSPRAPKLTSSLSLPPKGDNNVKNHTSPNPRVAKKSSSFSTSPLKKNKSPRSPEDVNSRGQKNPPSVRGSKESNKSPSSSGSRSITSKKSPKSPEAVNSRSNNNSTCPRVPVEEKKSPRAPETIHSCGEDSVSKEEESARKTQANISETNVKFLEEMVTLRQHVDERGEVTYHIPKQQFEDLSQGVQDVLHDLQSIKSALNIQNDDDE